MIWRHFISWKTSYDEKTHLQKHTLEIREGLKAEISYITTSTGSGQVKCTINIQADEHNIDRTETYGSYVVRNVCERYAEQDLVKICPQKDLPLLLGYITNDLAIQMIEYRLLFNNLLRHIKGLLKPPTESLGGPVWAGHGNAVW